MDAFLTELIHLTVETAPWLLLGFFLAGLLKVYIPAGMIYGQLGGNDFRSVLRASLYGVPLPLCSCSVLPTAQALKQSGASKGATASFLVSTPETGVDSISVTWALIDPIMTVIRPVVAFVTALVTGSIVNVLVRGGWDRSAPATDGIADDRHGTGDRAAGDRDADSRGDEICADDCAPPPARLRSALRYAFVTLLDDLTPWLIIGFVLSALIAVITPDSFFADAVPSGLISMLVMVVVAAPLYICATASTPIAAALIAKGLDPGAALVFLLVGPATNAATLLIVSRMLGRRALMAYLAGIVGVALAAGALVNRIYAGTGIDLAARVTAMLEHEPGPVAQVAGVILAALLALSLWRIGLKARSPGSHQGHAPKGGVRP